MLRYFQISIIDFFSSYGILFIINMKILDYEPDTIRMRQSLGKEMSMESNQRKNRKYVLNITQGALIAVGI